MVLMNGRR
ncbi:hypothetical protein D039_0663A, partial [Vibrio parahaemolyticus EKP-028]